MKRKILAGVLGSALVFTIALQCLAMGPWEPSPQERAKGIKSDLYSVGMRAVKDLDLNPPLRGDTCDISISVVSPTSDTSVVTAHCTGVCTDMNMRDGTSRATSSVWNAGQCIPLLVDNNPVACVCSGRLRQ